MTAPSVQTSLWRRVLQFPLVRLLILAPMFILLIGISNGFREKFSATPLKSLTASAGMALAGLLVYIAFVRLIERRSPQ